MLTSQTTPCHCGSKRSYGQCCEPYVLQQHDAPTAEALMRSRYTAFCIANYDYLNFSAMQQSAISDFEASNERTRWIGLTVVSSTDGNAGQPSGEVEFIARFIEGGAVASLHERSTFGVENGRWQYQSGEQLPTDEPTPLTQNGPCFCGSGKKYKRCHG